eukprot:1093969-Amphidinium_carterae.1
MASHPAFRCYYSPCHQQLPAINCVLDCVVQCRERERMVVANRYHRPVLQATSCMGMTRAKLRDDLFSMSQSV